MLMPFILQSLCLCHLYCNPYADAIYIAIPLLSNFFSAVVLSTLRTCTMQYFYDKVEPGSETRKMNSLGNKAIR